MDEIQSSEMKLFLIVVWNQTHRKTKYSNIYHLQSDNYTKKKKKKGKMYIRAPSIFFWKQLSGKGRKSSQNQANS